MIIVTFLGPERLSNDEILENRILEKVAGKKELEAQAEHVVPEVSEEGNKTATTQREVV